MGLNTLSFSFPFLSATWVFWVLGETYNTNRSYCLSTPLPVLLHLIIAAEGVKGTHLKLPKWPHWPTASLDQLWVNGVLPTKGTSVISHGERWERKEEEEMGGPFLFLPSVSPWKEDKDPMTQRRRASVRDEHKKFLSGPLQSKKSDPDNVAGRRSKTMNRSRSLFHPSIFFTVLIGWLATPDDELVFSHSLQYNGGKSKQSG